jgi:uncharacterized membrane protein YfcA
MRFDWYEAIWFFSAAVTGWLVGWVILSVIQQFLLDGPK